MIDTPQMIFYGVVKYLCYSAWCSYGLTLFAKNIKYHKSASLAFGLIRLLIGIFIGTILIFNFAHEIYAISKNKTLIYFSVYPPIRFLEWSFLFLIMKIALRKKMSATFASFLLWVFGGIVISCLADFPILLSVGLPIGRIFC